MRLAYKNKGTNPLKGLSVSKKLKVGTDNMATLTASLDPVNPDGGADNVSLEWKVAGTGNGIVSIEEIDGTDKKVSIVGLKPGTATVTVATKDKVTVGKKSEYLTASCKVTVTPSIKEITFTNAGFLVDNRLSTGKTYTIKTKLTLSGSGKAASTALLWESSDPSIATVSQKGVVKALRQGTVTITAKAKDNKAEGEQPPEASVTFDTYVAVSGIKLDRKTLTVGTNEESLYGVVSVARVLPENATDPSIKWTANNGNIDLAAIPDGAEPKSDNFKDAGTSVTTKAGQVLAVKALKPGTAKLTGITTDGSKKKVTCTVTIRGTVTGLWLKQLNGKNGYKDVTQINPASEDGTGDRKSIYTGTLKPGTSLTLTPVLAIDGVTYAKDKKTYNSYKKTTDLSVSYRSSNTSVATVNAKGKITVAKRPSDESVMIYVSSADGKQTAEYRITVK